MTLNAGLPDFDVRRKSDALGIAPAPMTREEFSKFVGSGIAAGGRIVVPAGIPLQ